MGNLAEYEYYTYGMTSKQKAFWILVEHSEAGKPCWQFAMPIQFVSQYAFGAGQNKVFNTRKRGNVTVSQTVKFTMDSDKFWELTFGKVKRWMRKKGFATD